MNPSAWMPWIKLVGLILVTLAGTGVAWWALFADRPRGRRRCPRCWYDLTWTDSMLCAECGFEASREKQFKRTRRRLIPAVAGIALATGTGMYMADRAASGGGVIDLVPNRVLIALLPIMPESGSFVFDEIVLRARGDELDDAHWMALLERCAKGTSSRRPPTTNWQASYFGRLATQASLRAMSSDDPEIRARAVDVVRGLSTAGQPTLTLSTRAAWPADVAITLDAVAADWWDLPAQMRIRATPAAAGGEQQSFVLRDRSIQDRSFSLTVPPLPPGTHDVEIDVATDRRMTDDEAWVSAGTQRMTLAVTVDPAADLVPAEGEALDIALRNVFAKGRLVQYESGNLPVRIGLNAQETFTSDFADTAVGIEVEVLRNGKLGRRLDIWWLGGENAAQRQYAWEVPVWDDGVLGPAATDDDEWTVRVRSSLRLALRVDGAKAYWRGAVAAPMRIRSQDAEAPARGWLRESDAGQPVALPESAGF